MAITLLKSVNFGRSRGGLSTVGFTLIDTTGTTAVVRTTAGVHEVGSNTGIYAAPVSFASQFSGSILWDTGETPAKYASEEYNPFQDNIQFMRNFSAGRWQINESTKQMIFYAEDNTSELVRFQLLDKNQKPSITDVFERVSSGSV